LSPVDARQFADALARIAPDLAAATPLALAVSGGPDSLAMLLLAADAGYRIAVLTVDHGLRPAAAGEAAYVAEVCAERRIPQTTLRATVTVGGEGVQAAARRARYAAMGGWCAENGVRFLLTAHHADDQAETLLMRLARGSGLAGMAGIRARRPLEGVQVELLRPLLGVRKLDLVALVEAAGLRLIADPSNDEPSYDRTVARRLLLGGGLDSARAAATAAHLADAEAALAWTADEAWAGRARVDAAVVELDARGLPDELVRRLVMRAIVTVVPSAAPDGPAVARLIAGLAGGAHGNLAGVAAEPGARWCFRRETPRAAKRRQADD
jgi:tRNA(Ile)-lysidine synthase